METATVFCPVQAVLDDESGGYLRGLIQSPDISDQAMNWDQGRDDYDRDGRAGAWEAARDTALALVAAELP